MSAGARPPPDGNVERTTSSMGSFDWSLSWRRRRHHSFLLLLKVVAIAGSILIRGMAQDHTYAIGAAILRPKDACPVIVLSVTPGGPADLGGIGAGDAILKIDGRDVTSLASEELVRLLRNDKPGIVRLQVLRQQPIDVAIEKAEIGSILEKQTLALANEGKKAIAGVTVPADTSVAEVERMTSFDGRRVVQRVFPLHYAEELALFSAAFEVYILRDPPQLMVAGIEDGPAARAGVHWGDIITSIDGADVTAQSAEQVRDLLSSKGPKVVRLRVNRGTEAKEFDISLERTASILKEHHRQIVSGLVLPDRLNSDVVRCIEGRPR